VFRGEFGAANRARASEGDFQSASLSIALGTRLQRRYALRLHTPLLFFVKYYYV